ncbi:peroxidase family protein [Maribacter luteus]|uniref:peroxidase family protein n=1 Tax=Maribacter luteus TaxID=2594478 RepID=UPI0024909E54|nr:heme peroxidase family protein [Maribacter luteus]
MLNNVSHIVGTKESSEILYDTNFGYIFEYLSNCNDHLLPEGCKTIEHLKKLGEMMADMGSPSDPQVNLDSTIPAVYTYLGQFIDHDITARTDRDSEFQNLDEPEKIKPLHPREVVANLKNGRRPQLDLDSVFGEGPSFNSKYSAQADKLFNNTSLNLFIEDSPSGYLDLRRNNKKALIADARNDENLIVSQLHGVFIKLFNKINTAIEPGLSNHEAYCRARQLTRWAYQYVVVNDYLLQVCDSAVVSDVTSNGPFFFNTHIPFMPLEFSVAGFRFGHSMIRPFYQINDTTSKKIMEILGPGMNGLVDGTGKLKPENVVKWSNFSSFNNATPTNLARKIDPFIAKGLFDLSVLGEGVPMPPNVLASLTQRNLLRGYMLSIPVGQAVAEAMRITPLTHQELVEGLNEEQECVLYDSGFTARTPLWYYVLQESKVQQNGNRLGYVGSKLVAETLYGLVKGDFNSYLNNYDDNAVTPEGILLPGRPDPIKTISDIFSYAEVAI